MLWSPVSQQLETIRKLELKSSLESEKKWGLGCVSVNGEGWRRETGTYRMGVSGALDEISFQYFRSQGLCQAVRNLLEPSGRFRKSIRQGGGLCLISVNIMRCPRKCEFFFNLLCMYAASALLNKPPKPP